MSLEARLMDLSYKHLQTCMHAAYALEFLRRDDPDAAEACLETLFAYFVNGDEALIFEATVDVRNGRLDIDSWRKERP